MVLVLVIAVGLYFSGILFGPSEEEQIKEIQTNMVPVINAMTPEVKSVIPNANRNGTYSYDHKNNTFVWEGQPEVNIPYVLSNSEKSGQSSWYRIKEPKIKGKLLLLNYINGTLTPIPLAGNIQATSPNEEMTIVIITNASKKDVKYGGSPITGYDIRANILMFYWPEKKFIGKFDVVELVNSEIWSDEVPNEFNSPENAVKGLFESNNINNLPEYHDNFG